MPLIATTPLLRIADRAAYQYSQIKAILAAISQQGSDYYWVTVTDTEDSDVEISLLQSYRAVDNDFLPTLVARNGTQLVLIVGTMENHFSTLDANNQPLQAGGWDGYLWDHNVRVSQYFAELYFALKNNYMLATGVFAEGVYDFATAARIAGPAITFTDGSDFGDGNRLNPANGLNFAATQLKAVVVTKGATNLALRISVKDINNNPTTIDVTIPAGSAPATEIDIGTASDRFLDVTGITFVPAGAQGSVGDNIKVRNKKERQIVL
jgi:hypothetical protein